MRKENNLLDLNIKDNFFNENLRVIRGFRLTETLDSQINEFASIHGLTPSQTIRLILTNYFDGTIRGGSNE